LSACIFERVCKRTIFLKECAPCPRAFGDCLKDCPGRRFWGFLLITSNHPRALRASASLEDYSGARVPQTAAFKLKLPVMHLKLAGQASHHLATYFSRESSRLVQPVCDHLRSARLAQRLAGRSQSPLHIYHATADRSVDRNAAASLPETERARARQFSRTRSRIAALSNTCAPEPLAGDFLGEPCRKN
jgi:hypothetical protein